MTKEEILDYLDEKRVMVTEAGVTWDELREKEAVYNKHYQLWNLKKWVFGFWIFGGIFAVLTNIVIKFPFLLFILFGYIIYCRIKGKEIDLFAIIKTIIKKVINFIKGKEFIEIEEELVEAQAKYQQEISRPEYLAGMENFPQEFYNTYAISRLEGLIREERALTLQEAYTILENQQFQEQTVSHQNKMSGQQDEIVRNTRIAAAAATMAAISGLFNDRRR